MHLSVALLRPIPEYSSRSMERFADELSSVLRARAGIEVTDTSVRATALARFRLTRQLDRQASSLLRYSIRARRQVADVFHVVDHTYAHLARVVPGDRAIVTCHDVMLLHGRTEEINVSASALTVARFRWVTSFLNSARIVACDSQATADDVVELVGVEPSRVRVIPLGVSSEFAPLDRDHRQTVRRRLDPTGKNTILLHVSTGGGYKNVRGTLEVLEVLRARGRPAVLVRVGPGLSDDDLQYASGSGMASSIIEMGRVTDADLTDLYGAADVLLFPSRWEGFGWPPLEALACGTPAVVASECRSVMDLIGDATLAASANDTRGLADAVERLVTDAALRGELVERGRRRVGQLTWEQTATEYVSAYEEIVSTGNRATLSDRRSGAR